LEIELNKYESFLERNTIRLYKKVDEFYEVESHLEYAIKGSICVDLLIFMIETLNKINNQEISHSVINGLVDALDSVFSVKVFYKMQDFASSKDEAAALLSALAVTHVTHVTRFSTFPDLHRKHSLLNREDIFLLWQIE
jgi:hypothetical protein